MFEKLRNRRAFEQTAQQASDEEIVCGTLLDDKPVYFTMPNDATEAEVRARAFEVRTGRPMTHIENTLLDIAERPRT
jgi:hypothetical protein